MAKADQKHPPRRNGKREEKDSVFLTFLFSIAGVDPRGRISAEYIPQYLTQNTHPTE
jgi:hypothetical protein